MCTLTVVGSQGQCLITMNRDDLIDRPEAPPIRPADGSSQVLAPIDLKSGGTWIGLNSFGIVACLLNRYDRPAPINARSRGAIVPEALHQVSRVDDAVAKVVGLELDNYAPFTCIILSLDHQVRLDWTRTELLTERLPLQRAWMTTSSSVSQTEVKAERANLFNEAVIEGEELASGLQQFHAMATPDDAWWSPWMERPLAHTKSITQVLLRPDTSEMRYWDRSAVLERGLSDAPTKVTTKHQPN